MTNLDGVSLDGIDLDDGKRLIIGRLYPWHL